MLSLPRRCVPVLLLDANCTIGLDDAGNLMSDLSSCVGPSFPQRTTWQGELFLELLNQCQLIPANSLIDGRPTNRFGNRIDYICVEQRRAEKVLSVSHPSDVERLVRHCPHRSDHYPMFVDLLVPPWPKKRRKLVNSNASKVNQITMHSVNRIPEHKEIAMADLDAFVHQHLPDPDTLNALPIDTHYNLVNGISWHWNRNRFGYAPQQNSDFIDDNMWSMIVERANVGSEIASRVALGRIWKHLISYRSMFANFFCVWACISKWQRIHKSLWEASASNRALKASQIRASMHEATALHDPRTFWRCERAISGARPRRLGKLPPIPSRRPTVEERAESVRQIYKGQHTSLGEAWGDDVYRPELLEDMGELQQQIQFVVQQYVPNFEFALPLLLRPRPPL